MENNVYPNLPKQFKELIPRSDCGQKVAELVCDELFEFFSLPKFDGVEPEILTRYNRMSYDSRVDFDKKYPNWRKGAVENYEKGKRNQETEFNSNLHWLQEWAEILKGTPREEKLRELISQYRPNIPKEATQIANQFGGKVVNRADWNESEG